MQDPPLLDNLVIITQSKSGLVLASLGHVHGELRASLAVAVWYGMAVAAPRPSPRPRPRPRPRSRQRAKG